MSVLEDTYELSIVSPGLQSGRREEKRLLVGLPCWSYWGSVLSPRQREPAGWSWGSRLGFTWFAGKVLVRLTYRGRGHNFERNSLHQGRENFLFWDYRKKKSLVSSVIFFRRKSLCDFVLKKGEQGSMKGRNLHIVGRKKCGYL